MRQKREKLSIEFEIEYDEVDWKGGWIPKTVYKYRNWEDKNHRKIIENIAVWVPDVFDFNDPFDCNLPISYDLLLDDEDIAEKFIRKLVVGNNDKFAGNIEIEVQKRLAEKKYKDSDFINKYKEQLLESNRKVNGVFSVTPINSNILMWSHYANSHKGFCIGFDSVKLFDYLGGGGLVAYENNYPIISPIDEREKQYRQQVLTKSFHWAYEVEYRLTTFQKNNVEIPIPPEAIVEVVFGANMSIENKSKIKNILAQRLAHVKCFSAIPDKSCFKINIIPESF